MPTIIVRAHDSDDDPGTVTLRERAIPVDLHNEHYVSRLIERVAWALRDAERLESRASVEASPAGATRRVRDVARNRGRQPRNTAPAARA